MNKDTHISHHRAATAEAAGPALVKRLQSRFGRPLRGLVHSVSRLAGNTVFTPLLDSPHLPSLAPYIHRRASQLQRRC
jgi:hypothetical protein